MNRNRIAAFAAVLALAAPAAAQAQDVFWDFVALNGGPPQANPPAGRLYYTTPPGQTVNNGANGSVKFTGQLKAGAPVGDNALVVFQYYNNQFAAGDEKGVGVCRDSANPLDQGPCYTGGEIGEDSADIAGAQWLILDLTGLTAGSLFKAVTLSSLTFQESWFFEVCTSSAFTTCTPYNGVSANSGVPGIYTINLAVSDYSSRWARFGVGRSGGDYVVQGITTNLNVVPEPGTMGLLATGLIALAGVGAMRRRNRKQ